jgi:multiple sugar transport system permease protein
LEASRESKSEFINENVTLVLLLAGALIILLPLLVVFLTSFAHPGATPNFFSFRDLSFKNYAVAWERGKFLLALANSTLIALAVRAFQIITSALAGYG